MTYSTRTSSVSLATGLAIEVNLPFSAVHLIAFVAFSTGAGAGEGPLMRRRRTRLNAFSNAATASGVVQVQNRQMGTIGKQFVKPHWAQVNIGLLSGTRANAGNDVALERNYGVDVQ